MRDSKNRANGRAKAVVALLFAVLVGVPFVYQALAAGSRLPQLNGVNPGDLFLEIARDGYGNTLDAETTSAKLIFGAKQKGQIGIYDGDFCSQSNSDSHGTSPGSGVIFKNGSGAGTCGAPAKVDDVTFTFSMLQDGPNVPGRALNIGAGNTCTGTNTPKAGCIAPVVRTGADFNTNGWSFVDLTNLLLFNNDTDQKFFIQLDVRWKVLNGSADANTICTSGQCGGVNTFKLWIPPTTDKNYGTHGTDGSYVTYATDNNSQYPLAIQQRDIDPRRFGDYAFQFAPDCTSPPNADINRRLKWQNADYGLPAQGINPANNAPFGGKIGWRIHDDTDNAWVSFKNPQNGNTVTSLSGAALGGDTWPPGGNPDGFPVIDFKGGHKYTWTWYNVDSHNGVQIWQPFSGYNYNRACYWLQTTIGGDVTWDISSQGTAVSGTAFVRNNSDYGADDNAHMEVAEVKTTSTDTQPWNVIGPSGYISNESITASENTANQVGAWGGSDCNGHQGFFPDTETPACNTSHWRWQFKPTPTKSLPANQGWISKSYNFDVSNTIPDGTKLCFASYVAPHANVAGADNYDSSNSRQCFTFKNPRFPGIAVHGGDAHAGGYTTASCTTAAGGGSISANANSGTFGDYVVSAGRSINGFGSAGGSTDTSLLFGYNPATSTGGFYARLCRPDLGSAVSGFGAVAGTVGNEASDINNNPNRVIQYTSTIHLGNLSITKPVTIWVSNGDLYLDGNITPGAAYGPGGPSFGVVVTNGRIFINKSVSNLFGYFYQSKPGDATSGIYTCYNYDNSLANGKGQVNDCSTTLNLYGFMSADNFHFQRVGDSSNNYGEILNPNNFGYDFSSLLINPPPAFTNADFQSQKGTLFDGERPPLY